MTRKFLIKIAGKTQGVVNISTDHPEVKNKKVCSIIYSGMDGDFSLDNIRLIPWIFMETVSNKDIIVSLADKAGLDSVNIENLPED